MYDKTVTVFNRLKTSTGDIWYPRILRGVNLVIDRAAIVARLGEQNQSSCALHIKYKNIAGEMHIFGPGEDFVYKEPKKWASEYNAALIGHYITFNEGNNTDFFMAGAWASNNAISDDTYTDGFFNYVKKNYDNVFAITSVGIYDAIPHFEVLGK